MRRSPILFAVLALATATARPLDAQGVTAGQVVNGQVVVQVYVTLGEGAADYNPLTDLPITLYRSATDSLSLRTDDAGSLKFAIAPGSYRLASAPARFRGRTYRWNVPLTVERGMSAVNLVAQNASVSSEIAAAAHTLRGGESSVADGMPYDRKSGTVATLLSLLVTGGGQMYAGKVNKGVGLLALGISGGVVAVVGATQVDQQVDNEDAWRAAALTGLAVSLGTYIYSIVTANGDVHEYNAARHPLSDAAPVLRRHDGQTGLGLALRF